MFKFLRWVSQKNKVIRMLKQQVHRLSMETVLLRMSNRALETRVSELRKQLDEKEISRS
jgi:hypothetical protein